MCGRAAQALSPEEISDILAIREGIFELGANYNLAPKQYAGVIRYNRETKKRALHELQWGLVPDWADEKHTFSTINAKAESLAEKPMYRGAWSHGRRCILPVTAYYEWKKLSPKEKQPYAIGRKDSLPVALGGLWESKTLANGDILRTFTVITTQANDELSDIHDRMPLVLEQKDWEFWLGETGATPEDIFEVIQPAHIGIMRLWPVSKAVGNVRNNEPSLLEEI